MSSRPGTTARRRSRKRDAVERVHAAGLTPVLAHPERCRAVAVDPAAVRALAEEGALLCLNAGSLVGDHGATAQRVAWRLVEDGVVALAASDGHGARRPPTMDAAWMAAVARLGEGRARPLFDGSALLWTDAGELRAARSVGHRANDFIPRTSRTRSAEGPAAPRRSPQRDN